MSNYTLSNNKSVSTKFMDALSRINEYFKKKEFINSNKLQLLEPLTSVIRLAMLNFEPIGTKIAIYNNCITPQLPNVFQGTIRSIYGNKRNELHNLYKPILMATHYYDSKDNDDVRAIFSHAIKGLEKLNNTYSEHDSDIVCHSIKLYREILLKKKSKSRQISSDDVTNSLYEKFTELWTDEQITLVAGLLAEASKENEETPAFLSSIDAILKVKENSSVKIINEFTQNITKT
jgi:hypothetical protein